jgi:hypothetical protein
MEKRQFGPQLGIRMSEAERRLVTSAADAVDRKESDWARKVILARAREELRGNAPPLPEPEETADLLTLRSFEAADPALPDALLDLGRAATGSPPLARAVKALAEASRLGVLGGSAGKPRAGRPRRKAVGTE